MRQPSSADTSPDDPVTEPTPADGSAMRISAGPVISTGRVVATGPVIPTETRVAIGPVVARGGAARTHRHGSTRDPRVGPVVTRRQALIRTALALMTSTVLSAALGFVFWVVAARWFPPDLVGRASAAVSAMSLLAGLAQLNLISLYARFLPAAGDRARRLILTGYAASTAMSVLLAVGFLASGLSSDLIGSRPAGRLIFVGAVIASAIFFIQDGVLAALRRPTVVPVKNVVASSAKLALLPLLAGAATGNGLLVAWALPMLVTMLIVNGWILTRLAPAQARLHPNAAPLHRREILSFASAEYVNGVITNTVAFLPPVLVTAALGPARSAYFYIPWVIGVAGSTMLWNVVTSFVVEAASDGRRARAHVNRAVALVAVVVGAGALVLGAGAAPLLALLGSGYAENGAMALRLIGLSLPFTGTILLYAAFAIMEKRMWRMVAIQSSGAIAFLAGSWYGLPRIGITAPALAFLGAQAAVAVLLLPGLVRRYRATGTGQRRPEWADGAGSEPGEPSVVTIPPVPATHDQAAEPSPPATPATAEPDEPTTPTTAGTGHQRPMAWLGLGIAVLEVATLTAGGPARAPAALAFVCLAPGVAILAHLRVREPVTAWALALLVSISGFTAVATVAAWTGWWQPRTVALIGAGAVLLSCLTAVVRSGRWRPAVRRPTRAGFGDRRIEVVHAALLLVATALWLAALARTDLAGVGGYGLLATVDPAYLAALVLCVGGFTAGLTRAGGPVRALPAYLVLLILIVHGSTPILLDQPQYAWTYKHIGVVEYLSASGSVGSPDDIYQQWPALFAATAQFVDLSGVTASAVANWSAVFFNLAGALVLFALARTLSADPRVAYLTVFGYLCVNWVEEDYLSPQALAFLLSLGALLVLLRWLRLPDGWLGRRGGAGPDSGAPPTGGGSRGVALVGFLAIFALLTATHQLSPYLVFVQVAALTVLRLVRPWWTPALMAVILVGYLVPRYGLVSGSFGLFEGINIFANAAGTAQGWGSSGQAFSAVVVRVLALSVWGLAALAVWHRRHRLRTVVIPAILAATPFLLLGGQSYGGEAIYRVFLFSAPWCAYLIATAVLVPRRGGRPMAVLLGVLLTLAALATVQGRHGQLVVDRQTTAEVQAARQLYANAVPGSTIGLVTPNFPSRVSANYGEFNRTVPVGEPDLVEGAGLATTSLGPEQLPVIENYLRGFGGTATYLVVSEGMRRQSDYFGYLPAGAFDRLTSALDNAPQWSVFYRNADVVIYQLDA